MQVMFLKVLYSLLSFLLVGIALGAAIVNYFQKDLNNQKLKLPWYVLLALVIMMFIDIAQLFSMLKAVRRSFMQFDPDN
jgi:sensor histidine kinase regulating citrate/malate metabolism